MAESDPTKNQQPGDDSAMEDSSTESEKQSENIMEKIESIDSKDIPPDSKETETVTILIKASSQEELIIPEEIPKSPILEDSKSTTSGLTPVKTPEDKSASESSWKTKGVGTLVEKFRGLTSPKRKDAPGGGLELMVDSGVSVSPSQEEKSQSPKRIEHSPGTAATSADDISSIPMTDDAIGMDELLLSNLKESGSPRKTSPLKNIIDKCINMIDTAKKVGQNIKPPFSSKVEKEKSFDSLCSECTRIRNTPHENLSFDSECDECQRIRGGGNKNFIQTILDKTKGYILGRMGQSEIESSTDSSSQGMMHQWSIDTPSSGILGDVSGNIEAASSSSTSPDIFMAKDPKSKPALARFDTVIEVKPPLPKPVSPLVQRVKEEETVKPSEVNLDITQQRRTLKRQEKIQENTLDPDEVQPVLVPSEDENLLKEEEKFEELLAEEKQAQDNKAENSSHSPKDDTGKRSVEFDSKSCSNPLKKQNTNE